MFTECEQLVMLYMVNKKWLLSRFAFPYCLILTSPLAGAEITFTSLNLLLIASKDCVGVNSHMD